MVTGNYKTTELGLIPSDWEVLPLRGNFDFFRNNTYSRYCLNASKGDVQNIHYGDVLIKYGYLLDCETEAVPFINPDIHVNIVRRLVQSGDVIIADTAEDNTVGKATEVINVGMKNVVAGLHTVFIRPHAGLFAERFLGYFFNSPTYHDQLLPYIVGTKVSSVSKGSLQETFVLLPPLSEQRRIAEVLSDTDALLAAMEKLIAKKRAIKQGAMRELLTGKWRLPGFKGKWASKPIRELADIISGGTPSTSVSEYWDGNIVWVSPSDVTVQKSKYLYSSARKITEKGLENSAAILLPAGTILLCSRATIGELAIAAQPTATNQGFKSLVCFDGTDNVWLYYAVQPMKSKMMEQATGSTFLEISKSNLGNIEVMTPPTKLEQTAIAEILSDMDSEIDALTAKLNKLRDIKRGMMSELLTGRIRLADSIPAKVTVEAYSEQKAEPIRKVAEVTAPKGHTQQFDDAVMIAGIVNALYSDKYPLGRKKVQKCLYLLRRHQHESTEAFKKKAAGPYAAEVRYSGGELIARQAKYIKTTSRESRGTKFARGDNMDTALGYIQSWGKEADIKWVADNLRFRTVEELELLATVDMAICDLSEVGMLVSVQSIKRLIAAEPEWIAKLKKQTFSDNNIARAIRELKILLKGEN